MTGLKDLRAEEKGIQKVHFMLARHAWLEVLIRDCTQYFKDSPNKASTGKNRSGKSKDSDDDEPIWLDSDEEQVPFVEQAAGNQVEQSNRKRKPLDLDVISVIEDDSDDDEVETICPVCSKLFSSKSNTTTVNQHINDCLDRQTPETDPASRKPVSTGSAKSSGPPTKKRKSVKQNKPENDVFALLMSKGRQ
jgi:hypothetical protein